MKTEVRTVTTLVAQEMLKRNFNNRALNESHVNYLSKQMLNGQWMFDGQPIRFDSNHRLLDGQHRLNAIVKSGRAQDLLIITGLNEETFQVMDTGKNRNGADAFSITGVEYYAEAASCSSFIKRFYEGKFSHKGGSSKLTNSDLLDWYNDNQEIVEFIKESHKLYREFGRVMNTTHIASMYFIFDKISPVGAKTFMYKLCTGLDLTLTDPIYILRKKLIEDKANKASLPVKDKLAFIIKAWNLYRLGKTCKMIRWNGEQEPFPKAI